VTIGATDEWARAEKEVARAILLEPSPYETDGGELIGRDPRKIPVEAFNRAGLEGHPLLTVWQMPRLRGAARVRGAEMRRGFVPELAVSHGNKSVPGAERTHRRAT
jgi:hypothetical protein